MLVQDYDFDDCQRLLKDYLGTMSCSNNQSRITVKYSVYGSNTYSMHFVLRAC